MYGDAGDERDRDVDEVAAQEERAKLAEPALQAWSLLSQFWLRIFSFAWANS